MTKQMEVVNEQLELTWRVLINASVFWWPLGAGCTFESCNFHNVELSTPVDRAELCSSSATGSNCMDNKSSAQAYRWSYMSLAKIHNAWRFPVAKLDIQFVVLCTIFMSGIEIGSSAKKREKSYIKSYTDFFVPFLSRSVPETKPTIFEKPIPLMY